MSKTDELKVLVVDDTKLGRLSAKKILNGMGLVQITECASGEEVLDLLKKQKIDLILMDILMPGIGGIDLLKAIRKDNRETRILMVSADIQDTTRTICLESGADGFINKPVSDQKLRPVLEEIGVL
ncbi:MAG: response regulator [Spirochaetales bacterium]|nr:response regulator [Spirochaetales bacterium]